MPKSHGEYRLADAFAEGGMCILHHGEYVGPHGYRRRVAIKRLKRHLAMDPEFVAMLMDEARLSARLTSPHWVRVLDTLTEGRELMLVMNYVPGASLAALRNSLEAEGGRAEPSVAAAIARQILDALADAHDATDEDGRPLQIVHRDVSPQNVLISGDGFVHLLDLGIARARWRAQTTRTGEIKGKPAYMAPEQILGEDVGPTADLFAVGIILWELLSGRRFHDGATNTQILERLRSPAFGALPPLPPVLVEFLRKALALRPEERFASARDMARALEGVTPLAPPGVVADWVRRHGAAQLDEGQRQRGERFAAAPPEAGTPDPGPVVTRIDRPPRGSMPARLTTVGGAAAALLALALAAWPAQPPAPAVPPPASSAAGAPGSATGSTPKEPVSAAPPPGPSIAPRVAASSTASPPRPRGSRRPAGSCTPPWTIDAEGVRTYKSECL